MLHDYIMNFVVVEGKRLNSIHYQSGGYLYLKVRDSKNFTYVRCTLYKNPGCKGFAKIDHESNTLVLTHEHDHDENAYRQNEFVLKNKLKRAAETSSERLRQVFNETCREDPANISVTFRQMESSMCKRRRKLFPPLPLNPEDFCQLIPDSPFVHLFKGSVNSGGAYAVIFASDFMLMKLKVADQIQFDATFYTVPSIFYQLFTIFISFHGHCIPAIHVLMQSKTEELYAIVLMKIREIIPEFSPKIAVCDFERAPRNVFSHYFPEINIIGCWFHFTQAIWKKTQLLGLASRYKTDKVFANWLRKLMALPLLPESDILGAFSLLQQEIFYHNEIEDQLIKKLKVYYKKTWIIGQKGLSVFSAENATNNGAEAFHKTLKSVITVHHPNIWKFLFDLNNVILDFELEYQRLEQGLEITRKPKRQTSENAARRNTF